MQNNRVKAYLPGGHMPFSLQSYLLLFSGGRTSRTEDKPRTSIDVSSASKDFSSVKIIMYIYVNYSACTSEYTLNFMCIYETKEVISCVLSFVIVMCQYTIMANLHISLS